MQKLIFDDIYTFYGGFGKWFSSKEGKLPIGTVRCIRGVLFFVAYQHGSWLNPITCWVPCDKNLNYSADYISQFREAVMSGVNEISFTYKVKND